VFRRLKEEKTLTQILHEKPLPPTGPNRQKCDEKNVYLQSNAVLTLLYRRDKIRTVLIALSCDQVNRRS